MLFDDDEQLEVRHVVSLAHHDVSIYSGGDTTPEGELFIKRNAICLSRRTSAVDLAPDSQISKPFYLFSENCSAKEDFYFALLRNQEQAYATDARAPAPLTFDVKHIISLVQKLHSSEEHLQSRWLNAMIGRIFLGLYRTADIEGLIREKLNKKISRVKRPAFLSDIEIRKIDTGESAPYFTNLRHKDLTVEGESSMEADVRYTGNFRIEVSAVARIDLGARLKAREVNLVLSLQVRKLEGHVLFKIKAPPSNRIWFSFSQMPKMEMTVEPIVSSRQITYTVILRQIEARIKEVIAETLVLPFWDDTPFFKTEHKKWRGGIFAGDDAVDASMHSTAAAAAAELGEVDDVDTVDAGSHSHTDLPPMEKSQSMPVIDPTASTGLFGLKLGSRNKTNPTSPLIDSHTFKEAASSTSIDLKKETPAKPRAERSSSFVSESMPIVGTEAVNADVFKPSSPPGESAAFNAMTKLSGRTKSISMSNSPIIPHTDSATSVPSTFSKETGNKDANNDGLLKSKLPRRSTASSLNSMNGETGATRSSPTPSINGSTKSQGGSASRGFFLKREGTADTTSTASTGHTSADSPKRISLAAMSNAAGAAKRWGWNALHRAEAGKNGQGTDSEPEIDLTKPMGGGRPLPPPGIPLPMPEKKGKTAPAPAPRRKPVPPPNLADKSFAETREEDGKRRAVPAPPLPKRRRQTEDDMHAQQGDEMLVVAAPLAESEPASPLPVDEGSYRHPFVQDAEDDSDEYHSGGSSGDASGEASGEGSANDTNKHTPPALPPRDDRDYVGDFQDHNEPLGEDDEYSAWMDNTGEDQPLSSHVTSEGLAH